MIKKTRGSNSVDRVTQEDHPGHGPTSISFIFKSNELTDLPEEVEEDAQNNNSNNKQLNSSMNLSLFIHNRGLF